MHSLVRDLSIDPFLPDIRGDKKSIRGCFVFCFFNFAAMIRKSLLTKNVFSVLSVDLKKQQLQTSLPVNFSAEISTSRVAFTH